MLWATYLSLEYSDSILQTQIQIHSLTNMRTTRWLLVAPGVHSKLAGKTFAIWVLTLTNGIYMEKGWHKFTHIIPSLARLWYPAVSPISLNHLEKWQIIGNKCPFQQQERHLPNESADGTMGETKEEEPGVGLSW